mmetsp:Transcript_8679/g.21785  ORF Transcript_8679/g.21785 Transcript_8679/m.21785 type:complete len:401 (-) Transcript_8679:845-2047(-)
MTPTPQATQLPVQTPSISPVIDSASPTEPFAPVDSGIGPVEPTPFAPIDSGIGPVEPVPSLPTEPAPFDSGIGAPSLFRPTITPPLPPNPDSPPSIDSNSGNNDGSNNEPTPSPFDPGIGSPSLPVDDGGGTDVPVLSAAECQASTTEILLDSGISDAISNMLDAGGEALSSNDPDLLRCEFEPNSNVRVCTVDYQTLPSNPNQGVKFVCEELEGGTYIQFTYKTDCFIPSDSSISDTPSLRYAETNVGGCVAKGCTLDAQQNIYSIVVDEVVATRFNGEGSSLTLTCGVNTEITRIDSIEQLSARTIDIVNPDDIQPPSTSLNRPPSPSATDDDKDDDKDESGKDNDNIFDNDDGTTSTDGDGGSDISGDAACRSHRAGTATGSQTLILLLVSVVFLVN